MTLEAAKSRYSGIFTVAPNTEIHGELILDGEKSLLHLRADEFFNVRRVRNLTGVLDDLSKVSLLDCVSAGTGSRSRDGRKNHFAELFPHFIAIGDSFLAQDEDAVTEIQFLIDDASTLFYDFDAFGHVIDARPFIKQIVEANNKQLVEANSAARQIETGENPEILYFTGKHEIVTAETAVGRVCAFHSYKTNFGGPDGVYLKNKIIVSVVFPQKIAFDEAINRCITLVNFLGLLIGRPQNLKSLIVLVSNGPEKSDRLRVHWSLPPSRDTATARARAPHPGDVLVNGALECREFSNLTTNWLERQPTWHDARFRFFNSFSYQRHYNIDRLIGSANMFDILPDSAVPSNVQLTEKVEQAKAAARRMFRDLPESPERAAVLGALGRLGKSNLKQKVRHRANLLIDCCGKRFCDLLLVTDQAVNCRNYYVHGGEPCFDYSANFDAVTFFTDTLEFVFAASDLIECGWDVARWIERPTSMSHPFGAYRIGYSAKLEYLKRLLRPQN